MDKAVRFTLPKMILFDYGHTLIYEANFNNEKGYQALMPYCIRNERNLNAVQIAAAANDIFTDIGLKSRNYGVEIHNHMFQRLLLELYGVEYALTYDEIDTIFWDNAAPGIIMPNADKMIGYLNQRGIRSGIISNISFSEATLAHRIKQCIPENRFEFIIASSEYVYRKPSKLLYELALRKAKLEPGEVWFCGDHPVFDILGASGAGIMPVWYQSELPCPYRKDAINAKPPECEHIHIRDWEELIQLLKQL